MALSILKYRLIQSDSSIESSNSLRMPGLNQPDLCLYRNEVSVTLIEFDS